MAVKNAETSLGPNKLSALGLGCASLAGIFSAVSREQAEETLKTALGAGIRYFDTAPFYGHGLSERRVGDALRGESDVVLSTKVGRLLRPGASASPGAWIDALPFTPEFDYSYDGVMRSYEASLQRLGVERIDILFLHDIGARTHGDAEGEAIFTTAMTSGYRALEELRDGGAIRAFGLGVNETEVCEQALECGDWDVFLLAGRYTLLEQTPLHGLLASCAARETDVVIGGPFNSGVLVGGKHFDYGAVPQGIASKVAAIRRICEAHDVSLPAAALHFPLAHGAVTTVIPGPRSPTEMQQILDWWAEDIPASLWSDLRSSSLIDGAAPVPVPPRSDAH